MASDYDIRDSPRLEGPVRLSEIGLTIAKADISWSRRELCVRESRYYNIKGRFSSLFQNTLF
jgi:hypothetical protein